MSERAPEGWVHTQLGKLIENIASGGTPSTSNPDFFSGKIPWAVINDIKSRIIDTETRITELGLKKSSARIWDKGTVVLSTGATIGRVGIALKPLATNQSICGIIPNESLDKHYLFHFLTSINRELKSLAQGSTIKEIRPPTIKKIQLALPPLPEQKKIAAILTSVDKVIENIQKQINKLQDLKKATMNELLTKGIGHTKFNDSELGKIPKSWEVNNIGAYVLDHKGGAPLTPSDFSNAGFPVIPKKAVQFGGRIVLGDDLTFCKPEFAKKNRNHVVDREYMITTLRDLVPTGPSIGLTGIIEESNEYLLAQGVYGFRLNSKLDPLFFSYISNMDWYRQVMRRIFVGSTQIHIRNGEFLEVLVPVPDIDEQKQIVEHISSFEIEISLKRTYRNKIMNLKKSLMQDLLTGKVRTTGETDAKGNK